ncbi:MAG: (d)CMP kinase [Candidatus Nanopelagicales bacterium]|nr:(d)CMP kinase [Candidatus Nanopelagicales bacterium]
METAQAVVAIDGPSGSGKSSTSRGVARALGLEYLDTGAMYRAMAWYMLDRGVDVGDPAAVAARADEPVLASTTDPDAPTIAVDGVDVSAAIRGAAVTGAVSPVAAVPAVRERLVALQRAVVADAARRGRGIVVEGRDIGTVVLPDATAKIYLTADAGARAARRALEDAGRAGAEGPDAGSLEATAASLAARDAIDSNRAVSPLAMADGAVHVDGTHLTLAEVIERVVAIVREAATSGA